MGSFCGFYGDLEIRLVFGDWVGLAAGSLGDDIVLNLDMSDERYRWFRLVLLLNLSGR